MNVQDKLRAGLPVTAKDVRPMNVYDVVPQTPSAHLRIDLARLQAKVRRIEQLHLAAWQREQDRLAEAAEAARERRRRGR